MVIVEPMQTLLYKIKGTKVLSPAPTLFHARNFTLDPFIRMHVSARSCSFAIISDNKQEFRKSIGTVVCNVLLAYN